MEVSVVWVLAEATEVEAEDLVLGHPLLLAVAAVVAAIVVTTKV